ncbi:MAG: hypothetical protein Q9172_006103 [Xanthocarpia lactea]
MARGPLSNSKDYYDRLQPQHKRLIRHMIVSLHITDLTLEAFDSIESQLRAKDVARGRLPPDDSVEDWVAPVVYNLVSIWRSKLAWLQTWTWLEDLEIHTSIGSGNQSVSQGDLRLRVSHFKIKGKDLPEILRGIGPVGPHCPVMNCYKECNSIFGKQMQSQEKLMWDVCTRMIELSGWKCSKALIRRLTYKEANTAISSIRWIQTSARKNRHGSTDERVDPDRPMLEGAIGKGFNGSGKEPRIREDLVKLSVGLAEKYNGSVGEVGDYFEK